MRLKALKTFRNSADNKMVGPAVNNGEYEAPDDIGRGHVKRGMALELPGGMAAASAPGNADGGGRADSRGGKTGAGKRRRSSARVHQPRKRTSKK